MNPLFNQSPRSPESSPSVSTGEGFDMHEYRRVKEMGFKQSGLKNLIQADQARRSVEHRGHEKTPEEFTVEAIISIDGYLEQLMSDRLVSGDHFAVESPGGSSVNDTSDRFGAQQSMPENPIFRELQDAA